MDYNQLKSWLNVPVEEGSQVQPYVPPPTQRSSKKPLRKIPSPQVIFNACFALLMLILVGAALNAPTTAATPTPCVEVCPPSVPVICNEPETAFTEPPEKSEASPISVKKVKKDFSKQADAYVKRYAQTAQMEMRKFGIPASISLAQGLIESRAGTSKLAVNNNNHFGIKCFARNCKKGHCTNFTDDSHKDFFRKFPAAWWSWREHSQLLASGRYKQLHRYGKDYRKWAYGLQKVGYATDRRYAEKLIGIIETYELYKYD